MNGVLRTSERRSGSYHFISSNSTPSRRGECLSRKDAAKCEKRMPRIISALTCCRRRGRGGGGLAICRGRDLRSVSEILTDENSSFRTARLATNYREKLASPGPSFDMRANRSGGSSSSAGIDTQRPSGTPCSGPAQHAFPIPRLKQRDDRARRTRSEEDARPTYSRFTLDHNRRKSRRFSNVDARSRTSLEITRASSANKIARKYKAEK